MQEENVPFVKNPVGVFSRTASHVCPNHVGPVSGSCTQTVSHTGVGYSILHLIPGVPFLMLAIPVVLAVYAAIDMRRRGQSAILWGALVFLGSYVGLIVWLIARRKYPPALAVS